MRRARDNPFAIHRVLGERYRLAPAEWSFLLGRLESLGRRAAIVGPHGSGKTTLLEDLGDRLETSGWHIHFLKLTAEQRAALARAIILDPVIVLCDGAEQLSFLEWKRLRFRTRLAGGLVITTHREGRLPTLHFCQTSPAVLSELAASLGQLLTSAESAALHARHGGNVRNALRELYDMWSRG